ncbi:hypothetical protein Kpho02_15340 [Kitasatospora phosalacinea]|uniref:Uncharacterized protein n=1 Tax=Kitasatospora phosalacinea TaxID=2065 RepID=A0A9W6Q3F4_9ACTN|nr:hypothetical protein [Kitasatospora phosalacinea]GLW69235.1 hypothetical protein Kpho02_15340 [Kitasatospora phosalacinea]
MTHTPARRLRAGLAAASAVALSLLVPGTAGATTGTPLTPTDLTNGGRPCATDPAAPAVVHDGPYGGPSVSGTANHTDPSAWPLDEEFAYWRTTDPAQGGTLVRHGATPGSPTTAYLPGLPDGQGYAWRARTVDPATGAASDWSAVCYLTTDNTAPATAPTVTSSNYPEGQWAAGGSPVRFTFAANGTADVVDFRYSWPTGQSGTVHADAPGGSATVDLVPPAGTEGPTPFQVQSLDRAGNVSRPSSYVLVFLRTSPTVTKTSHSPMFGKPATFRLTPDAGVQALSPVVSYTVTDTTTHESTTVPAGPDGTAELTLVLKSPRGDSLEATSTSANGWMSSRGHWSEAIDTTPTVTSADFPEENYGGAAGTPGTFHFAPKIKDAQIASYTYRFGWSDEWTTVPAGPHGEADVSWTPPAGDWYVLESYATTKDGIELSHREYYFAVN